MRNIEVRPLTSEEIERFDSAVANEQRILDVYGRYSEHDSIEEGKWIMRTGQYAMSAAVQSAIDNA